MLLAPPDNTRKAETMLRLSKALIKLPLLLAALATVAMMIHVGLDVFARLLFYWHAPATMEITAYYYMVFIVFAGVLYSTVRKDHISVEVFDRFFAKIRGPITLFRNLATLIYFAFFAYCGYFLALRSFRRREVTDALSFDLTIWPSKVFLFLALAGCCFSVMAHIVVTRSRAEPEA